MSSDNNNINEMFQQAQNFAKKAIEHDNKKEIEPAVFYYIEATQALISYKQLINEKNQKNANTSLDSTINQYLSRAELLKNIIRQQNPKSDDVKNAFEKDLEKVFYILSEALDEDTNSNLDEALELYTSAIEFFIKIKKQKDTTTTITTKQLEKFKILERNIPNALQRAEEIKKKLNLQTVKLTASPDILPTLPDIPTDDPNTSSSDSPPPPSNATPSNHETTSHKLTKSETSQNGTFSKEEIDVLRHVSNINGQNYVPFFTELDSKERFSFSLPFTDKSGHLALSKSQKDRFSAWVRPDEIYEDPKLMMLVSSFSVKQTCISDCSFVASLTVIAQYERKFNKQLLAKIIFPQNKNAEPIYNPCGKYMVRLHLNGCWRKIIIDDYLPIDKHNNLLCSMTTNRGELWVSLLEKAYLKVMGGYDFPGSNSNIDLHSLTNWIPERLSIHAQHTEFDRNKDFDRMFERLHTGHLLITVATGPLSKQDQERTGLVDTHAYAVLDIRRFNDMKLFQLKNPWSHLKWKGNFSENDTRNWTDEIKKGLNYDPHLSCNVDNGIFWIDYDSLLKFFDVFYLSWEPDMFSYTSCYHRF
jgi:calpain-7